MRQKLLCWIAAAVAAVCMAPAFADEASGCSQFKWDVSHELALMKQTGQPITAAAKPGPQVPKIEIGKLYDVGLTPQDAVTYAADPAKQGKADKPVGGLVRFRVGRAGTYRVSITSGHWIDVADGGQLVKSKDHLGAHGCSWLHKIVEFELPANRELILQFSGAADSPVKVAITPQAGSQ